VTTEDFIIALFMRIDDEMKGIHKHSQANLYPSEIVTLGILFSLKGVGNRAFYRWLKRDWVLWFPKLPERTRLFRLFKTHRAWTDRFLAKPTVLGVVDSYGVELLHPCREGRSDKQIGKKGYSNRRWIVGSKVCWLLNQKGLICSWDCATANVHDTVFHPLIQTFEDQMIVLADHGFHSKQGNPKNLKVCKPKTWNVRMLVETMLSMLTTVCHFKHIAHRSWEYFKARVAFTMAAFNLLIHWHGLQPDPRGFIHLSIAEFSL
jgi:hypothetical protein